MESILNSIKSMLNISKDDDNFDTDVIIHINSVFSTLKQLGVGPEEKFRINDDKQVWSDFTDEDYDYDDVKTYVYLKVKKVFDPPANASLIAAMNEEIKELEWRLTVTASNKKMEVDENDNNEW